MNGVWSRKQESWSPVEKKAARYAFDLAYKKQCEVIREKVQKKVEKAASPTDLWKIHDYLSKERRRTDALFDYRYSVLLQVFAALLKQGRIHTDDLAGLSDEKLQKIERCARLTKES